MSQFSDVAGDDTDSLQSVILDDGLSVKEFLKSEEVRVPLSSTAYCIESDMLNIVYDIDDIVIGLEHVRGVKCTCVLCVPARSRTRSDSIICWETAQCAEPVVW